MGIDLVAGGKSKRSKRTDTKSPNVYLNSLVELYQYLARRTDVEFNRKVLKRLVLSKTNRPPMKISRVAKIVQRRGQKFGMKLPNSVPYISIQDFCGAIACMACTVTDDPTLYDVPKLKLCALKFTATARARILKAGGECLTFDQLALQCPTGENCYLLQGKRSARESCRHFGPGPGVPHSHTKPFVRSKGRKFERARGRRKSRGYKA